MQEDSSATGKKGCDGCIDFGHAANTGLGRVFDRMEKNYRQNQERYLCTCTAHQKS